MPYPSNGSAFLKMLKNKLNKLKKILKKMDSVLLAYSGGVDSTFLLKACRDVLGDRVLAVTASSLTYPKQELLFSKKIARKLGAKHKIIFTQEIKNKKFSSNPLNRCYFCKRELFKELIDIAKTKKLNSVIDASNLSDKNDFRPGDKAGKELGVRSPLEEAGLTKEEIRLLSKQLGLETWDKDSLACLASRLPYNTKISPQILKTIDKAERYLINLGFNQVRVRHYNNLCRIEVAKRDINRILSKREEVCKKFKTLGYNYVTVDLEGYRTGSLNEALRK